MRPAFLRFAIACAVLACARPAHAAGNADLPHPRLGLYGQAQGTGWPFVQTGGALNTVLLDQVGRYDTVVLPASPFTEYRPDVLDQLRLRNPKIQLCAYLQPDYVWKATQPDSTVNLPTRQWILVRDLNGFLYLKSGAQLSDANINLAKKSGNRFVVAEALSDFYRQAVLGTGKWDGLFLDRFCTSILWQQSAGDSIDYVRAGYPNIAAFDAAWHAASDTLANRLRRLAGTTPVVIGNCAQSTQYFAMNGWMHENFPFQNGGTWDQNMFRAPGGYTVDEANFRAPQSNWLVSWVTDIAHPYATDQVRRARFGFGTATLADGFGVFNPSNLDVTTGYLGWWYDEYAVDAAGRATASRAGAGWLGKALAPYTVISSTGPDDAASLNPGFEIDVSGWSLATTVGATLARDATTAAVGVASGRVRVPAAGANSSSTRLTTNGYITLWPGPPYQASFWARAAAPRWIRACAVDALSGAEIGGTDVSIDTSWRRYTVSITPPASGPIGMLQFKLGGAATDVWIDDAHLVRTGINLYRRDFERGTVLVNPTSTALPVLLEQTYRRILGTVDPATNNGASGTQFTIPGNDALFLIRATALVGVDPAGPEGGVRLAWTAAAPNPASAGAPLVARLTTPSTGRATAFVYDVAGRRVRTLLDRDVPAGEHAIEWNGTDDAGRTVPRGLYFLRASAGGETATRKVVRD